MSSEPILYRQTLRLLRLSLIVFALIAVLSLVVLSPIGMRWFADGQADWSQLSDIGQAYGGISAILSTLAILGVAVSLILQNRQVRAEQALTLRNRQMEIIKITIDNPELAIQEPEYGGDTGAILLGMHSNLWMQQWRMAWDLGFIGDAEVRNQAAQLFMDERRHHWWDQFGPGWDGDARHFKSGTSFVSLVDQGMRVAKQRLAETAAAASAAASAAETAAASAAETAAAETAAAGDPEP
ncbi:DUF6082 family protein [Actinoplanes sp. GCM10030250]|uniref:DUF6082 family protein n=1 Tax=Actinoplanes sp. GCM10030250 TaxID=3273376 RepID=UPI003614C9D9